MAEKSASEERAPVRWDPFRDLARWDPFRDLTSPWPSMARMMEEMFSERPRLRTLVSPPVDITESDEAYTVTAEVPGVKRDELTLEIQEGVLSIRGEKKSEREETRDRGRYLERTYGAFSRSFTLPPDADADRIAASFQDGVLKITLPKRPESKPKQIAIKK